MPQTSQTPGIKALEVAFPRVGAPDLDLMEEFLTKLGLVRSERTRDKLFMRGTGPAHHLHVTELGEPRNIGLAFHVRSEEDLHRMAAAPGASPVEEIDEPGGGKRVLLREPNGYQIELVHGMAVKPPTPVPELLTNSATHADIRKGRGPWGPDRPPHVARFGHAVLLTERFEETLTWFKHVLGMKVSDEVLMGDQVAAAFARFDHGAEFVDHHVLNVSQFHKTGWHHFSYEVENWSEVFSGAANLAKDPRFKYWAAPTRHYVGGQVGAYFGDPWGRVYEFWADGDLVNSEHKPQKWPIQQILEGPDWSGGTDPGFFEACMP